MSQSDESRAAEKAERTQIDDLQPSVEELPCDPQELTAEEAEAVQGGLSNTSFRVNTLTFSSNATGIG
jgi:hypothetical protein